MRACLYARVSTARQGTDDHFSLPVQEEMFLRRCAEKHYTPGERYVDTDSGTKAGRKAYQKMLADARTGLFDVVVVRDITRFGRDQDEIMFSGAELRRLGIKLDPILTSVQDGTPPAMAKFLGSVEAFIAENTSAQIAVNVKQGMTKAAGNGVRLGMAPYGYTTVNKKLVINDEQAPVVKRIFEEFADKNNGPLRIAVNLNNDGVPSPSGHRWAKQTLSLILQRETYAGVDTWAGVQRESPAIISRDLWERAQMRWRSRKSVPAGKTHTSTYLLSGILFCECGARMQGKKGSTRNRQWYYQCRAFNDGSGKSNTHLGDDLDQRVIQELVRGVQAGHEKVVTIDPPDSPLNELVLAQRDLALIPGRRRKMLDDFSRGAIGDDELAGTREIIREDEERLQARVDDLRQRVEDAEARKRELAERPERVLKLLDPDLPVTEKKAILQDYAPRIIVRVGDPEPYIVA